MPTYAGMDSSVQKPYLRARGLERHPLVVSFAFGSSGPCGQEGHFASVHEAFLPGLLPVQAQLVRGNLLGLLSSL